MSKVDEIRKEIERLKEETFDNKELTLEEIITARNCYNNLLFFIDSLEQPIKRTPAEIEAAMQEIEEKSKLFTEAHKDDVVSNDTIKVVSNDLEEAACEYDNSHIDDNNLAFNAGAQWQKERDQSTIELAEDHAYLAGQEKIIDKACEWLSDTLQTIVDVDCPSEHHVESIPALGSITQTEFLRKFKEEIKYLFD